MALGLSSAVKLDILKGYNVLTIAELKGSNAFFKVHARLGSTCRIGNQAFCTKLSRGAVEGGWAAEDEVRKDREKQREQDVADAIEGQRLFDSCLYD